VSEIDKIAKDIVMAAFEWSVFKDGSVGVDLRGGFKHLTDLNLDAETEIFVRRTIRDHIAYKIAEAGARRDADLLEEERKRNERKAQGGAA
jgi:hypothetical protein